MTCRTCGLGELPPIRVGQRLRENEQPVALARDGFDDPMFPTAVTERPSQLADRAHDRVVGTGAVVPDSRDEALAADGLAGMLGKSDQRRPGARRETPHAVQPQNLSRDRVDDNVTETQPLTHRFGLPAASIIQAPIQVPRFPSVRLSQARIGAAFTAAAE